MKRRVFLSHSILSCRDLVARTTHIAMTWMWVHLHENTSSVEWAWLTNRFPRFDRRHGVPRLLLRTDLITICQRTRERESIVGCIFGRDRTKIFISFQT